jgi:hypothetical protein
MNFFDIKCDFGRKYFLKLLIYLFVLCSYNKNLTTS